MATSDNFRDLVAFVNVVRHRSFTRAAAQMGLSQAALSYTIKGLEERLGVRLFTRTTRNVMPTEAGERLFKDVSGHLDEVEQALQAVRAFSDRPAGNVRIATSDHAATTVLQPMLDKILPAYPDITVELVVDNALSDIVEERCDAGVRLGERLARDMIAVRISPDLRMAVAAAPGYFARTGYPAVPQDLLQHNCIRFRFPGSGRLYDWEFERGDEKLELRVKGQFISNSPDQIVTACVAGLGVGFLQESYFEDHIRSGKLVRVLADWCEPFPGYYLYYPSRRQPTSTFTLVLNALRSQAAFVSKRP
jgi:DNA-binding transcriptional LysR family regulator